MRNLLAAMVLVLGACASGSSSAPSYAFEPVPVLARFAPLVGGTWTAELNAEATDEQTYVWLYGGKFLRNAHRVTNRKGEVVYEGETIYAFDARGQGLVWWYWNSTGGHIVGTGAWNGARCEFEGENHAGPDQTERVKARIEVGAGELVRTSWFWKDGAWVDQGTRTYRRAR
jgi:hypothetical protein